MKKNTKIQFSIFVTITSFVLFCQTNIASALGSNNVKIESISVRLPWIINNESAGMFIALEKEFYLNAGLDVKINGGGLGIDPVKLVASQEDNFGVIDSVSLITAVNNDIPLVGIAATFQKSALGLVTIEPGIKSVLDLKGKIIGRQPVQEFIVEIILASAGLTLDDVKRVSIGFDLAPLLNSSVDAQIAYISDQPIKLREMGKKPTFLAGSSNGYNFYGNVVVSKKSFVSEHPDLIDKFLEATGEGWAEACNDKEAAVDTLLKYNSELEGQTQLKGLEVLCGLAFPNGRIDAESWGKMNIEFWNKSIESLVHVKKLEKRIEPSSLIRIKE